ncbi:hypothetical protein FAM09_05845 [Niastella caeni]|uniref:Uncharacterized protein n=1 Tax=Niastella caeni TaxID=2569763 RepID=A0A4S8I2M7_9BACT|nr:hypothetical protein [Niastella caeni]THU41619.1 hypothetical protein FAM09_05845 [Niastella caeni]
MNKEIQKEYTVSVAKRIVAGTMVLLLLWITGINFLYSSKDMGSVITCIDIDGDEENGADCNNSPTGPDEKSPDAPLTVSEEFLHIYHSPVNPDWINMYFQHKVHEAEKLCIFHPELFSPPPEA